jgi:hypothetical protein
MTPSAKRRSSNWVWLLVGGTLGGCVKQCGLTLDETLWDMNGYEDVMASCIEDGTFTSK